MNQPNRSNRSSAPDLLIQLTKRPDGDAVLRCLRPDGSVSWQRHRGPRAGFFPLHDLTHYVVESELGFRHGFFGLIAEGWDISETGERPTRGSLPPEARSVEFLVGLLDTQRAGGSVWTADEVNEQLASAVAAGRCPPIRPIAQREWSRVTDRLQDLSARWGTLMPGHSMELAFHRAPVPDT